MPSCTLAEFCGIPHFGVFVVDYADVIFVSRLIKNKSIGGIDINVNQVTTELINKLTKKRCDGCLEGKFIRAPMTGKIDHHAKEVMDEWVCDIIGPINIPCLGEYKYILTMVDVASRKLLAGLLKHRSDAQSMIIKTITRCQVETGKKVKKVPYRWCKRIIR